MGSYRIDGVALICRHKSLWPLTQIGGQRRLIISTVLHQRRNAHPQRYSNLGQRGQRRDNPPIFDLREQTFGTITGTRQFLQRSALLCADTAHTNANVHQPVNSILSVGPPIGAPPPLARSETRAGLAVPAAVVGVNDG